MEIQAILDMVTTVGFPIVICFLLLWYIFRIIEAHKEEMHEVTTTYKKQVQDLGDKHQQECKDLATALNNNTIVMTQILEQMRRE